MVLEISGQMGTLICDGWNNRKRNHLVAFALVVHRCSYPTQVHDNISHWKDGRLALQQISAEISQVQEVFQVKVIAVCTESGSDQVSLCINM